MNPLSQKVAIRSRMNDIHDYAGALEYWKRRISNCENSEKALGFLSHLEAKGKSIGRIVAYATRTPKLLNALADMQIDAEKMGSKEAELVLSILLKYAGKGWTKFQYALLLKKFINYVQTGNSDKDCEAVAWIKPSKYNDDKDPSVDSGDLLTEDEVLSVISAVQKISKSPERDTAMLWTLFECALRPGELLTMRVGDVQFKDNYCLITARGKTGPKRGVLILAYSAMMAWINRHPEKENMDAPLWYNMSVNCKGKIVGYQYLVKTVKRSAKQAGIKKRVWNYLFRHTQLTRVAPFLRESRLNVFAGWAQGSKMARRYIHLSGADIEDAVLEMHGLKEPKSVTSKLKPTRCPRCNSQASPSSKRCAHCGLILDPLLATEASEKEKNVMQDLMKRLENLEKLGAKVDALFEEMLQK